MDKLEYRAVIKFLTKKGLNSKQITEELVSVYNNDAPCQRTVERWHLEFLRGRNSIEDEPREGRPATSVLPETVTAVQTMVVQDPRVMVRVIANTLDISTGSVETILHERLHLTKVSARWVPKFLTVFDRARRVDASKELLQVYNTDPENFEARIVTGDETYIYDYQPETKEQSKVWVHKGSPPPVKFKVSNSAGKTMVTVFWDTQGVILLDYLERGKTMNGVYYAELLKRLREAIKQKRRGKLSRGILLQHDNAPAHTSHVAQTAAHDCGFQSLPHPPYSPDLAPSDFHLFCNLKKSLGGSHFSDVKELKSFLDEWFCEKSLDFYLQGIQALPRRWQKCIDVDGGYVEKI